jgi:hypothetical protein
MKPTPYARAYLLHVGDRLGIEWMRTLAQMMRDGEIVELDGRPVLESAPRRETKANTHRQGRML